MKLKALKTKEEYETAPAEIEKLMETGLLVRLVHTYEESRYPIDLGNTGTSYLIPDGPSYLIHPIRMGFLI